MNDEIIIVIVKETDSVFDEYLAQMNRVCMQLADTYRAFGDAVESLGTAVADFTREMRLHKAEAAMMRHAIEATYSRSFYDGDDVHIIPLPLSPLYWRDIKANPMPLAWAPVDRPTAHARRGRWMMPRRPVA